jgi:hypothetical protein
VPNSAPWLRARENLKDHRNYFAGTARDYSTTFGASRKDCKHMLLAIQLSQRDGEGKKKKRLASIMKR